MAPQHGAGRASIRPRDAGAKLPTARQSLPPPTGKNFRTWLRRRRRAPESGGYPCIQPWLDAFCESQFEQAFHQLKFLSAPTAAQSTADNGTSPLSPLVKLLDMIASNANSTTGNLQ